AGQPSPIRARPPRRPRGADGGRSRNLSVPGGSEHAAVLHHARRTYRGRTRDFHGAVPQDRSGRAVAGAPDGFLRLIEKARVFFPIYFEKRTVRLKNRAKASANVGTGRGLMRILFVGNKDLRALASAACWQNAGFAADFLPVGRAEKRKRSQAVYDVI